MDDYDDIKKRLSPLNEIKMSAEKEQEITDAIHQAAQAYRDGRRAPRVKRPKWIGHVSAVAAAVVAAAGMIIVLHTRLPAKTPNTSAATNNTTSNTTAVNSTVPITYTQAQLTNVRTVAKNVGVNAWIPSRVLPGDALTVWKSGGNELILDYKHIWLIESNKPIANPPGITQQKSVDMGGSSGTFIVAGNNTFMDFQKGGTYIQMENLTPDQPISLTNMKGIAESFELVR